jgi:ATP-dependent Clp protease ATP-binding subunit ClpB
LGPFLKQYGVNLTKLASDNKLDAVIGRDEEIQRAIQVLCRRTKNNPIFLGEAGVGKTAVAEGIALRIASGDVPNLMKNKVIISLDIASLLSGTKFRGEFEERLRGILDNIQNAGERIIIFIDEIHLIAGAGAGEGGIDAGNILKPPLARGLIRCMGATTSDEYRKYIEKDGALARRFQPIFVSEPTVDNTVAILNGIKKKYELYHKITISPEAISSACKLTSRYITDRKLPDKAIDALDEASSRFRLTQESKTAKLVELETKLNGLKARNDLRGDESALLATIEKEYNELTSIYDGIQQQIEIIHDNRVKLDSLSQDYDKSLALKDFEKCKLLKKEMEDKAVEMNNNNKILSDKYQVSNTLDNVHVADVIARTTGIPIGTLLDGERQSLLTMEKTLGTKIIGQDPAIHAISKCIRISRSGLRFHDRPLGCFLFLGPTGTGKTELAKALSEYLFQSKDNMLRIDMSEFMERYSVSRLIGSERGYIGYEEGGVLTNYVRRYPYSLLLLDEFEKAHPEVSNLLLQVFDEGRLGDAHGRIVDFRNTVIILTSNLGCEEIYDKPVEERYKSAVDIVNKCFSTEFVNRLDEIVLFNPLDEAAISEICEIQLNKIGKLFLERNIKLDISDSCKQHIATNGYSSKYGARSLKRYIQNVLFTPLSSIILEKANLLTGKSIKILLKSEDSASHDELASSNELKFVVKKI